MKSERVSGIILLIIPLLIIMGFIVKNQQFWILVDVVVVIIATIISFLLLLKKIQLNQEWIDSIARILLPIAVLIVSVLSFHNSKTADNRIERLYQAQRASDIQVTPVLFEGYLRLNMPMARLYFELINYTGFQASNVKVDAKFSEEWLHEWEINAVKALEEMKKRGPLSEDLEIQLNSYRKDIEQVPFIIEPNEVKSIGPFRGNFKYQQGKENKIIIRVSWDSENNAHFEKFYFFRVEISKAYDKKSYVLIPVAN